MTNLGDLITEDEFEDYPILSWEDYDREEEFMDTLCGWWPPVDPPDWYWDSISWPERYVTDLDAVPCWDGNGHIWGEPYTAPWRILGFKRGEVPKHIRYKSFEAYKHRKGESRRRQYKKKVHKKAFRSRIKQALVGNFKKLRKFSPATSWDVD